MQEPFRHGDFRFGYEIVLGSAYLRAATYLATAPYLITQCEPMGLAVRDARVFDWLDRYLAA